MLTVNTFFMYKVGILIYYLQTGMDAYILL